LNQASKNAFITFTFPTTGMLL